MQGIDLRAHPARVVLATAAAVAVLAPASALAAPSDDWSTDPAVRARVDQLVGAMTNAEKADLATGELNNFYGFYNNGIPRLGIPAQTMSDGPVGVRIANPDVNGQRSTEMPSGTSLASTFDLGSAATYGDLLGSEAFATGHNTQLAPAVDIARDARWGRAFEAYGEDPLLTGDLAAAYIRAIQRHPVEATIKHFDVYNQETDRFTVSANVSDRAIHEIYGKPFEIGVRDGNPGAAMCAFNRVNGVFACENPLMNTLLKGEYGFPGFVMSDYNATPSTAPAANAGLDQEQPGVQGAPDTARFGVNLLRAVEDGEVSQARLDDMATRILLPMAGLGLLDHPPVVAPLPERAHGQVARELAARGMVLLQNRGNALPLNAGGLRSIAVIGSDADNASAQGGGSSVVRPTYTVSPLEGIRARAGAGVDVTYAAGTDGISEGDLLPGPFPVPSSVTSPASGSADHGLHAEYWSNDTFSGAPHLVQTDPDVNVNFGFYNFPGFNTASPKVPTARGDFALLGDLSARWTGTMTAPATGDYRLGLTARGDATLRVDGATFVTHGGELSSVSRAVHLTAGESHTVQIDYAARAASTYQGGQVRFFWEHADDVMAPAMRAAVDSARGADAAVLVLRDYETEGADKPSIELPKEQDQLIRAVAAVNPHTVVVLNTGAPSRTSTWQDDVSAIVQAWYPGQEQGNAIADVLFGDVNPSGKLPVTIPVDDDQTPTSSPAQFPGIDLRADYSEGVFVGYRGFEELGIQPSFPFGHGLSYTSFAYSGLKVDGGRRFERVRRCHATRHHRRLHCHWVVKPKPQGDVRVSFALRNSGQRDGAEVAQVYVGRLPTSVPTPPRQLAAFERVELGAGQRTRVTLTIPRRSLSYWDSDARRWVTPTGRVAVYVGGDSQSSPLTGTVRVR
jgi:beta-glucosidase